MSREQAISRALRRFAVPLALAGVLATAWSSVALTLPGAPTAAWWPAAGIAIALVVVVSRRTALGVLPGIFVLISVGSWLGGRDPGISIAFGAANLVEVTVVGLLIRRFVGSAPSLTTGRDPRHRTGGPGLTRLDELWWVALAAVIGAALASALISLAVIASGQPQGLEALRNVFAAHVAGTLLVVPMALTLGRGHRRLPLWETTAQVLLLLVVMLTTLVVAPGSGLLALAPLPILVWAGLRLGTRVVIWELLLVAVAITVAARLGTGPFSNPDGDLARVYLLGAVAQSYIICAILTALPLAVTMEQRRELLHRVLTSERVLRRSFSESVVGLLALTDDADDLRVDDLNDAAEVMFGAGRDQILGRRLGDLFELDALDLHEIATCGVPWRDEVSLAGRPCTRIGVAISAAGADPTATRSAQLVDLTPVREAHQRADRERELSRAVAETAVCLILLVDTDGVLVAANPAATAMLGWEESELVGRNVWELLPAERQGHLRRAIADLPARSLPESSEADLLCRNGGRRRVLWSTDFAREPDGAPTMLVMTGIDVTAQRSQQLLVSQLLEAAMTTAIIGADADGRIAFFNSGAERLLGRSAAEAVGTPFVEILDRAERDERFGAGPTGESPEEAFVRLTQDVEPAEAPHPEDLTWSRADGTGLTVSTTLSMVSDPGLGVGFLCIGRDVTEQRETQELLVAALDKERTAVERLQALDRAKNDFVSTVSHELRTPVTSIVGYSEMLRDGTVDGPRPDQAPFLDAIARNAERLIGLADDLLTLSGLESGTAELGHERLDLTALVERARDPLSPLLRDRDLVISYLLPEVPVEVDGDADHLDRVLVNLVGNAVKFTDDGGRIDVCVSVEGGEAVLRVSDTGIGIPDEEQARLFTKFFRSSTAQERAIQGTGLGLSIVASVVAAHGGRVEVRSAHLAGTTFSVYLPLRPDRAMPSGGHPAWPRQRPALGPSTDQPVSSG